MGLQPLNRYLLGANWMYNRDIIFDLSEKMVHIYDNVQCMESAAVMGQYTDEIENNSDLIFSNKENLKPKIWRLNTNSSSFVLGIACLILALIIAAMLCLISKCENYQEKRAMIVVE